MQSRSHQQSPMSVQVRLGPFRSVLGHFPRNLRSSGGLQPAIGSGAGSHQVGKWGFCPYHDRRDPFRSLVVYPSEALENVSQPL